MLHEANALAKLYSHEKIHCYSFPITDGCDPLRTMQELWVHLQTQNSPKYKRMAKKTLIPCPNSRFNLRVRDENITFILPSSQF